MLTFSSVLLCIHFSGGCVAVERWFFFCWLQVLGTHSAKQLQGHWKLYGAQLERWIFHLNYLFIYLFSCWEVRFRYLWKCFKSLSEFVFLIQSIQPYVSFFLFINPRCHKWHWMPCQAALRVWQASVKVNSCCQLCWDDVSGPLTMSPQPGCHSLLTSLLLTCLQQFGLISIEWIKSC